MQPGADDDHAARGRLQPHELPFVLMAAAHASQQLVAMRERRRRHRSDYREVAECAKREQALMAMLVLHFTSYDMVSMPPIVHTGAGRRP